MKDYFGREIAAGDIVVYPGRKSSVLYLRDGVVLKAFPEEIQVEMQPRLWNGTPRAQRKKVTVRTRLVVVVSGRDL